MLSDFALRRWKTLLAGRGQLPVDQSLLIHAEGWRPEKVLAHYRTIQALPHILGRERNDDAAYLETCRNKRNIAGYECVGQISAGEARELIDFGNQFRETVVNWLEQAHPGLSPWRRR